MTNAEQYWIWQQEQPTDVLIVGKQKREPNKLLDVWKSAAECVKISVVAQDNVNNQGGSNKQDAHLLKHGIQ